MAGSDAIVLSIPWPAVAEMPALAPDYWTRVNRELARECAALLDKLVALSFGSLEARIASFLLEVETILSRPSAPRLTQGMIAKAVGGSRPKVNLCLKRLERRGVIAWRGAAPPRICDRAALRRLR